MTEVERISEQIRRAFEGKAWHGPSVLELLADVRADRAAARPIAGAHTICELVHHIAAWEDMVGRVSQGRGDALSHCRGGLASGPGYERGGLAEVGRGA